MYVSCLQSVEPADQHTHCFPLSFLKFMVKTDVLKLIGQILGDIFGYVKISNIRKVKIGLPKQLYHKCYKVMAASLLTKGL